MFAQHGLPLPSGRMGCAHTFSMAAPSTCKGASDVDPDDRENAEETEKHLIRLFLDLVAKIACKSI